MGRYSDSEDSLKHHKKKKKKYSHSRSRSGSCSSRYSSKHKKSKKSKVKHRKRSRSRERVALRSRSTSRGRRSTSRGRRSRSRSRERVSRRSRSRDRRSRSRDRISRSSDKYRRSRSRSREKYSYSRRRSRSDSLSRSHRSRTRSRDRSRRSRSYDKRSRTPVHRKRYDQSPDSPVVKIEKNPDSLSSVIPGFDDMTPSEQATARMRLALKAAAAADEKILGHSQIPKVSSYSSLQDMTKFSDAVEDIESASFEPKAFRSARSNKTKPEEDFSTHEMAIFGAGKFEIRTDPADKKNFFVEPDNYAHPNLYCDPEEKMQRWIVKLTAMRRRKLEGEAY